MRPIDYFESSNDLFTIAHLVIAHYDWLSHLGPSNLTDFTRCYENFSIERFYFYERKIKWEKINGDF